MRKCALESSPDTTAVTKGSNEQPRCQEDNPLQNCREEKGGWRE